MTLDTRVYVLDRIDHRGLFARCSQLIGAHDGIVFTDEQDKTYCNGEWAAEPGNSWTISNKIGQGLCALLDISYRPDGPLHAGTSHWDDCEPECGYAPHLLPRWAEVSLDTAYSYRGPDGGCGDLHARIVAELGKWLDDKGVRWMWENEFTAEIHDGYDGLTELAGAGAEASNWYRNIAAPAIAAHMASRQS